MNSKVTHAASSLVRELCSACRHHVRTWERGRAPAVVAGGACRDATTSTSTSTTTTSTSKTRKDERRRRRDKERSNNNNNNNARRREVQLRIKCKKNTSTTLHDIYETFEPVIKADFHTILETKMNKCWTLTIGSDRQSTVDKCLHINTTLGHTKISVAVRKL